MEQAAIRRCDENEQKAVLDIINDGARAYDGHVPPDRLHHPYMSTHELQAEIASGVEFWGLVENGALVAVIGMQRVHDVILIRHAYVTSDCQNRGLGGKMVRHLQEMADAPMLVGTWADAGWAIRFYQRHGFTMVVPDEKEWLLRRYWKVPERQIETSVVLADDRWVRRNPAPQR